MPPKSSGLPADIGREMAFQSLQALAAGATWSRALRHGMRNAAPPRDRRFAHELVTGCVRLRDHLDWILAPASKRPLAGLDPDVRILLRLGLYQTLPESRVAEHAAVHATVELAKRHAPQAAAFINAVLRSTLRRRAGLRWPDPEREPVASLAAVHSHPAWIVERWLQRFGFEDTRALCIANNRRPELSLRPNRRRITRAALLERLPGSRPGEWSDEAVLCGTASYLAVRATVEAGLASVQDQSAMLVAPLLAPAPGMEILDLAAAPGGKTCHLAEIEPEARIHAFDRSAVRLEKVRANVARLGLENISIAVADARTPAARVAAHGVLVDAPCSGLGVLARRPDLRWRKQLADLPRLAALQLELLEAAAPNVAPGGRLVYSVCSFEPEETIEVAARFAARHAEFEPVATGHSESLQTAPGILYLFPHRHGTDGGFAACWRRRA